LVKKEKGEKTGTQIHELICEVQRKVVAKEKKFKELEKQWLQQLVEIERQYKTIRGKHNIMARLWFFQSIVQSTKRNPMQAVAIAIFLIVLVLYVRSVVKAIRLESWKR